MQISAKKVTEANKKNELILKVNTLGGKVIFHEKEGMVVEIQGFEKTKTVKELIASLEN